MTTTDRTAVVRRVALVTGVGRREGLGFEVCRQLAQSGASVLLTARDLPRAEALAAVLADEADVAERAGDITPLALDITSDASVSETAAFVAERYGRLDVLVNNAAHGLDAETPSLDVAIEDGRAALDTNVLGTWRVTKAFAATLRRTRGRVVNVSSGAASFADGISAYPQSLIAYCVSKAALNALTVKLAGAFEGSGVLVNAICPGHIATYEGAEANGARPVSAGAAGVLWAAMLPEGGPSGGFFRDREPVSW